MNQRGRHAGRRLCGRSLCGCMLLLCLVLGPTAAVAEDSYASKLAYYEMNVDRPPLRKRVGAMNRLASTKDPRALKILARRYAKPRVPKVQERYLLSVVLGRHFSDPRHAPALWRLLHKHRKDEHAWLWRNALAAAVAAPDLQEVEDVILDARQAPFVRAAALEALGEKRLEPALRVCTKLLHPKLPKPGPARMALVPSCVAVLLAHREERETTAFRAVAALLVDLLPRDDVEPRTKLLLARFLARIYGVETITTDHPFWRQMLSATVAPVQPGGSVVGRPRFYGVEAAGSNVAYVLDMSDSMLEPLTPRELADARLHEPTPAEGVEGIEWDTIRSRFDLARAYLKSSLQALGADVRFVVVTFGDVARPLKSTKGLVKASRGVVKRVERELDGIKPGSATGKRPHGTLLGDTNLHTALLRAFRAAPRSFLDEEEDVDPSALLKGCDTLFVFGDGKPTKDDFDAVDRFDGGKITADRETGETTTKAAGSANYFGPYVARGHLLDDLRRMNLFRKAEIHTVAIGEADSGLMRRMAELGLGRYRSIGMLGREGRINAWWLLGPFPAPDVGSWEKQEAPEQEVVLKRPVAIGEEKVHWKRVFTDHRKAYVNLNAHFETKDKVAAYAYAEVRVEEAGAARLKLGSDDGARVWVNGSLLFSHLKTRRYDEAQDSIDIELKAGVNRILVKVCDDAGPWGFSVRLTDRQDRPLSFLMAPE